jgi:hypothetical protein
MVAHSYRLGEAKVGGVVARLNAYLAYSVPNGKSDRDMLVSIQADLTAALERARTVRKRGKYHRIPDEEAEALFDRLVPVVCAGHSVTVLDFHFHVERKARRLPSWFHSVRDLSVFTLFSAGASTAVLMRKLQLKNHSCVNTILKRVRLELQGRFGMEGELQGGRLGGPANIVEQLENLWRCRQDGDVAHVERALDYANRLADQSKDCGPLF